MSRRVLLPRHDDQTGGRASRAFREIDHDLVLSFARAAKAAGAQRFVVVTAAGADPRSKNFYLRVKGEVEQALERIGVSVARYPAARPAPRLAPQRCRARVELLATAFMPLVNPFLGGSRIAPPGDFARTVAAAAMGAARVRGRRGMYRYTWPALQPAR